MSDRPQAGPTRDEIFTGTATYTRRVLSMYDVLVLGIICRRVWRCDRSEMLAGYDRNIGERHLDLGPGTGFFLDRCQHRSPRPRIALVDLNPLVLQKASARLRRFRPRTFQRDVLSPFELGEERYESAGLNFLLHCLPGGMKHKAKVFDHVRPHVVPGGRIFGSTVLAEGVPHGKRAYKLLDSLNEKGTFDNRGDSLGGLEAELDSRFTDYRLTVRGSVALFEATA
ncbi:class I SAM-dependent methyltransferase [Streptomyces resistomycificus]|uniref:class I SAM-dependent methyltransferase n=1 Tax=Streptomyces resistomycificus TaxID=67356 RepID=UPI000B1DFC1F|nr:class I SAM-dependent methyltransferase [Streptomyces resistomycificus]